MYIYRNVAQESETSAHMAIFGEWPEVATCSAVSLLLLSAGKTDSGLSDTIPRSKPNPEIVQSLDQAN